MEEYDDWIKAGKIAAEVREYGCDIVRKGESMLEVANLIYKKTKELGGEPAFPINLSLDSCAAHDSAFPEDERRFEENVVKVDVGVHVNGAIGDTASTVDLSGKNASLVKASRDALNAALELVAPGRNIEEIGGVIQQTITEAGFAPIRNLSGHGLSRYEVHDSPSIPNTKTTNAGVLKEGDIIAIEPFATEGAGMIQEAGAATIFSQISERPVRDRLARSVLSEVKKWNKLPFSALQLSKKFSPAQLRFGLLQLKRAGIIRDYPPLVDISKGLVSQAEHTIIVLDEPIITTSIR